MKTAIIVAGVCRYSDIPSKTWDIFPFKADMYISTWDTTNDTFSNVLTSSFEEIQIIKENTKNNVSTRLLDVKINDYAQAIYDKKIECPYQRPLHLLKEMYEDIRRQNYQRIIYFRPDLYIQLHHLDNPLTEEDFIVNDDIIKIIGLGSPECWINHETGVMEDHFFCMTSFVFEKFINLFKVMNPREPDIHKILFKFFKRSNITIETIDKLRCCLVRKEIEEYFNITGDPITWDKMIELYVYDFKSKANIVSSIKRDAINLKKLDFRL